MFTLIESKQEIQNAQMTLKQTICSFLKEEEIRDIGFPSGKEREATVYTNKEYWYYSREYSGSPSPRYLNWFGVYTEKMLQITVEINVLLEGVSKKVGGCFARHNRTGNIYLLHSGRIGGGRRGVGLRNFISWSDMKPASVINSNGESHPYYTVMPIDNVVAVRSALRYVGKVYGFKQEIRDNGGIAIDNDKIQKLKDYYSEFRGTRSGTRPESFAYESQHGEIVDALHAWRTDSQALKSNESIVKNVFLDMGVKTKDELVEAYEVKTSAERSDIYKAIGQLLVHGGFEKVKKYIVLPKQPRQKDLIRALKNLDIAIVKYRFDKNNKCKITTK